LVQKLKSLPNIIDLIIHMEGLKYKHLKATLETLSKESQVPELEALDLVVGQPAWGSVSKLHCNSIHQHRLTTLLNYLAKTMYLTMISALIRLGLNFSAENDFTLSSSSQQRSKICLSEWSRTARISSSSLQ
jgi:hypothetical protein